MDELNILAEKIVSMLIFEENFKHIYEESGEINKNVVQDEVKQLIVSNFVKPVANIETGKRSGIQYDSDKMFEYSFQLTAKGMHYLELKLKAK